MYASIFGNLTVIIQRLYLQSSRQKEDLLLIREFVNFYKIPRALKENLENHILHESQFLKAGDLQAVSRFPEVLFRYSLSSGKTDNRNMNLVSQLTGKLCCAFYHPLFKPVLQQIRLLQGAWLLHTELRGRHARTRELRHSMQKNFALGQLNFFLTFCETFPQLQQPDMLQYRLDS